MKIISLLKLSYQSLSLAKFLAKEGLLNLGGGQKKVDINIILRIIIS